MSNSKIYNHETQQEKDERCNDLFERYKILVSARNFHYENFNKWLTYFYVANAAIFLAFYHVDSLIDKIPILLFGTMAGTLLYWSSKGYYFWNLNFILLVNHYEKELLGWSEKEGIYSMFANKSTLNNFKSPHLSANFSTSKIAILFSFFIASSWLTLLIFCSYKLFYKIELTDSQSVVCSVSFFVLSCAVIIGVTGLFSLGKRHFLWSNLNPLDDLNIDQKQDKKEKEGWFLIFTNNIKKWMAKLFKKQ